MSELSYIEVETDGSERWTGCLLHGFGAGPADLSPIPAALAGTVHASAVADAEGGRSAGVRRWLLPHAPVAVNVAGMSQGRAWFPREEDEMEQAVFGGYFQSLRAFHPNGLKEAARLVREMLYEQRVVWDRLVLGGFSQGAIVAAELVREALIDEMLPMPSCVVLFSGALVAESWWTRDESEQRSLGEEELAAMSPEQAKKAMEQQDRRRQKQVTNALLGPVDRPMPHVFQSHGRSDSILPLGEGEALRTVLTTAGMSVDWHEFDGGHSIPESAIAAAGRHIAGCADSG